MSLTIKVDNNALKSASTSLSTAAGNIEPIVNKISNLKIDNPKIKNSIKKEMESAIDSLASELKKLQTYIVQFADDTNVILNTVKELDEKYDSLSAEEKGALFWKNTVFESSDDKVLQELIKELNAAGLMTANGVFSSSLFESPYDLGSFVAAGYENREAWREELVNKYMATGFTKEDAEAVAAYDMALAETRATGATVLAGGITLSSIYDGRREALQNKIEADKAKETKKQEEPDPDEPNPNSGGNENSTGGNGDSSGGDGNNSQSIRYRQTDSTPTTSSSTSNNTPSNTQQKVEQSKPDTTPSETPSNNTENSNSNNNTNTETPSTDNNSNTNTNTGQSNNSNTNTNNGGNTNSGNNTNSNTNNGTNSNTTPEENTGSNTPINNGNTNTNTNTGGSTYYGPSNSSNGNYNNSGYSNNNPTIIPDPSADAGNAATTTPSAPESDAGIVDNSGEELDVISIDKGSTSEPSTSSSGGGSVIPAVLGVGAAGVAAVAGVKFIKNKKEKENTYEDESSEEDNSFSYLNDNQEMENDSYSENISTGKYKAGNVNDLVLDDAPDDLKIESSMRDITDQKEELE